MPDTSRTAAPWRCFLVKTRGLMAPLFCALFMAQPAAPEPALGFGFSFSLGKAGQVQTGLGLRVFARDTPGKITLSLGADYILNSGKIRPTAGLAKMDADGFRGIDLSLTRSPALSVSGGALSTRASRVSLRRP